MSANYHRIYQELRQDRKAAMDDLMLAVGDGAISFKTGVDMGRLFESVVGRPLDSVPDAQDVRARRVMEAENAVGLDDFRLLTSQLIFRDMQDRPANAQLVSDRLCRVEPARAFTYNETIPWFPQPTRTLSTAKQEGKPYKEIGTSGAFIQIKPTETFGAIIKLTKKLLMADKTGGSIQRMCRRAIEGEEIDKELRRLKVILGTDATSKWVFGVADKVPGSEFTVYNSTGGLKYLNVLTGGTANPFVSWKSLNVAMDAFRVMVDPITGERLTPPTRLQVVASQTLLPKIYQHLMATEVDSIDRTVAADTVAVRGMNPITFMQNGMGITLEFITSPWIDEVINSGTTWFVGDFKEAFIDIEGWPTVYDELANGGEQGFYADIISAQKVSMDHKTNVYNPFLVLKNVAT